MPPPNASPPHHEGGAGDQNTDDDIGPRQGNRPLPQGGASWWPTEGPQAPLRYRRRSPLGVYVESRTRPSPRAPAREYVEGWLAELATTHPSPRCRQLARDLLAELDRKAVAS